MKKFLILWFLVMPLGLYSQINDLFYVFGGGTIGYSESPSFSEFAQFYNDARKDELEKGLGNFMPSYGFNLGSQLITRGFKSFSFLFELKYTNLYSNTSAIFKDGNQRNYRLIQHSILVPLGFGYMYTRGTVHLNLILLGFTFNSLKSDFYTSPHYTGPAISTEFYDGFFTRLQLNVGIEASATYFFTKKFGIISSFGWVGNMLPSSNDRSALIDDKKFDDDTIIGDGYIEYKKDGEIQQVKSDNRGLRFDFGFIYNF